MKMELILIIVQWKILFIMLFRWKVLGKVNNLKVNLINSYKNLLEIMHVIYKIYNFHKIIITITRHFFLLNHLLIQQPL
jgi:hypothetical protein